jgi:phage regulator Rha-like protein
MVFQSRENELTVTTLDDGVIVIDSVSIADVLEIQHKNFLETVEAARPLMEPVFGIVTFKTRNYNESSTVGRPSKIALLNEAQATYVMTLCRNSDAVLKAKLQLVKAFMAAKQLIQSNIVEAPQVVQEFNPPDPKLLEVALKGWNDAKKHDSRELAARFEALLSLHLPHAANRPDIFLESAIELTTVDRWVLHSTGSKFPCPHNVETQPVKLYRLYKSWCAEYSLNPLDALKFNKELRIKGATVRGRNQALTVPSKDIWDGGGHA